MAVVTTAAVLLYGGYVSYSRAFKGIVRNGEARVIHDAVLARFQPAVEALPPEETYRLVMVDVDRSFGPYEMRRGTIEYFLAPIVVDTDSTSPWLLIEAQSEAQLDQWFASQPAVTVIARFGNGLALAADDTAEPRP